jgi:xanthine dehydrogenase accessory factor
VNELFKLLQTLKKNEDYDFALATIVLIDGSAYRHEGAKMLIRQDGKMFGILSAGCLEEDIKYQAESVIEDQISKIVDYDLSAEDDLSWGQGAGCNGKIKVYIEPIKWNDDWHNAANLMEQKQRVYSIKQIKDGATPNTTFLFDQNYQQINTFPYNSKLFDITSFTSSFKNKIHFSLLHTKSDEYLLFETMEPKDQLLIFGAGPDVEPLVTLAERLDFETTIVDPRSSRCNRDFFPTASNLVVKHPDSFIKDYPIFKETYVILMTHNFTYDQVLLKHFLTLKPKYLGVLGPTKRANRLVSPEVLPAWVHSPIGLDIGAEGPEEISISILAELIKTRNNQFQTSKKERFLCPT